MKNLPIQKILQLLNTLKGKKPAVIGISIGAIIVVYYMISKGYISESAINIDSIITQIDQAFQTDTTKAIIDTTKL